MAKEFAKLLRRVGIVLSKAASTLDEGLFVRVKSHRERPQNFCHCRVSGEDSQLALKINFLVAEVVMPADGDRSDRKESAGGFCEFCDSQIFRTIAAAWPLLTKIASAICFHFA